MNKFFGETDNSYQLVFSQIEQLAQMAREVLYCRQNPTLVPRFEDLQTGKLKECLQSMRVTDPRDILENILNEKEKRSGQSCKWILTEEKFSHWTTTNDSQLLRIIGPPGIGKTMMATFIAETISAWVARSSNAAFAYFFCDDKKGGDRRLSTAILRSLIWQLLLQNNAFFKYVERELDTHDRSRVFEDDLENFPALWRMFRGMLQDPKAGEIFILIDALDECDRAGLERLVAKISDIFSTPSEQSPGRVKFLVTHRPQIAGIEEPLRLLRARASLCIEINSSVIKDDLEQYIHLKTRDLVSRKPNLRKSEDRIRKILEFRAEGTFLWVSLMVAEIGRPGVPKHQVEELLRNPPSQLGGIYASILNRIDSNRQREAKFILHCMVAAERPLTKIEIMIAYTTFCLPSSNLRKNKVPTQDDAEEYDDIFSACSSILLPPPADSDNPTIGFCHQSVKDFLLKDPSRTNREWYHTTIDKANLLVFQTFWKYLTAQDGLLAQSLRGKPRQPGRKYELKGKGDVYPFPNRFLKWGKRAKEKAPKYLLLEYVFMTWKKHAVSCYPAAKEGLGIDLDEAPELRDLWFLCAARSGQIEMVRLLLRTGDAVLGVMDAIGATPLSLAAENGHVDVVKLLLATRQTEIDLANIRGQTPLSQAAVNGHLGVVKMLLATGRAKTERSMQFNYTPLHRAAKEGHLDVVKELLASGADINSKSVLGDTAMSLAMEKGHRAVVDELSARGARSVKLEEFVEDPIATQDENDIAARLYDWLH